MQYTHALNLNDEEYDIIDDALRYVQDQHRLDYRGRNVEWLEPRRDAVRRLISRLEALR